MFFTPLPKEWIIKTAEREDMNIVEKAKDWAHRAHDSIGQKRKYGDQPPYWVHTDAVVDILKEVNASDDIQAAGHLHDTIEDVSLKNPEFSKDNMLKEFGERIVNLVVEVTNVYEKVMYPDLNRKTRKELEHKRLGNISNDGKTIKLADIIHNVLSTSPNMDDGFVRKYIHELAHLLPYLKGGNEVLYNKANQVIVSTLSEMNK